MFSFESEVILNTNNALSDNYRFKAGQIFCDINVYRFLNFIYSFIVRKSLHRPNYSLCTGGGVTCKNHGVRLAGFVSICRPIYTSVDCGHVDNKVCSQKLTVSLQMVISRLIEIFYNFWTIRGA